jgi:tryptophan 7-halogenase
MKIETVVIAGGGVTGWSAAAALKRRLPWLNVTIIAAPPAPDALADRMSSTLPSILGFHADLGLCDDDAILRTGSSFRLGTRFAGWATAPGDYVHAYGPYGQPFGTASFHQHYVRATHLGTAAPFDRHSAPAMLGRAGRFVMPGSDPALGDYEYGLHIDPVRYAGMMRAFALHLGVREVAGPIGPVTLRSVDGFIEAVGDVAGDLFVDCTGPQAMLRSALDTAWDSWAAWLTCDRIAFADAPPSADLPPLDDVIAHDAGWYWQSARPGAMSNGCVFSADLMTDPPTDAMTLAQGTRPQPWLRNCIAVGDAATVIEPLEWSNLHLAHSAIDRLVEMLPDRDCAPIEIADYNRQAVAEAERVRDFVILHYAVGDRPEPFWQAARAMSLPASLDHTLTQFRARGRLPFYEEETFSRDSWLAVLLGQGAIPTRVDALIDPVPPAQSDQAMAAYRNALSTAVTRQPTHAESMIAFSRQTAR